jgi:hypothetical protein
MQWVYEQCTQMPNLYLKIVVSLETLRSSSSLHVRFKMKARFRTHCITQPMDAVPLIKLNN